MKWTTKTNRTDFISIKMDFKKSYLTPGTSLFYKKLFQKVVPSSGYDFISN